MLTKIKDIASLVRNRTKDFAPSVGVVLGSGLGSFADNVDVKYSIPYSDIDGFPVSTVEGHDGRFIFGTIKDVKVIIMKGRFHYYEGYSPFEVTLPIRVMKLLGVETLMLSNAAGGINESFSVGDLMIITDHINFIPNPLIGANIKELGDRFPDMSNAYTHELISLAHKSAERLGISLRQGCYAAMTGPSYETPSEIGFLKTIGADAVGMSTAPEVIAAAHCSMKVFALSVITNITSKNNAPKASHNDVIRQGAEAQVKMGKLFVDIISSC